MQGGWFGLACLADVDSEVQLDVMAHEFLQVERFLPHAG